MIALSEGKGTRREMHLPSGKYSWNNRKATTHTATRPILLIEALRFLSLDFRKDKSQAIGHDRTRVGGKSL